MTSSPWFRLLAHSPLFDRLLDPLENAASVWKDVKSQAPTTQQNLVPLTKLWSQKTEEEMEAYQGVVTDQASIGLPLGGQNAACCWIFKLNPYTAKTPSSS